MSAPKRKGMWRQWIWPLFVLAGAWAAGGCTDNCMQLQDQLCYCQGQTQTEQSTCESNASTQEGNEPVSAAELLVCARLLPGCTGLIDGGTGCNLLQTDMGRQVCGIQTYPDGG